jgi:6,7-dimethyl-8-ribityllumazine synthase
MKESVAKAGARASGPRPLPACALILATTLQEFSMDQTFTSPSGSAPTEQARRDIPRIAIVSSRWHEDIVNSAIGAALAELERHGISADRVHQSKVPGAFEIPLRAQRLIQSGKYDAIIACGLVVNGGIYRHEFVNSAVIDGLMRVQLDTGVPVFTAVLTPRDFHDHEEHQRFFREHFVKKGQEVATACLETLADMPA